MEGMESTSGGRTTGKDENQDANNILLMSSKPLHRFVNHEPKSLGIATVFFGCAELLMGFLRASDSNVFFFRFYIPFWEGFLFLICGSLSIYTEIHPSKKMVTVSLAMYAVSILGIVVSFWNRIMFLVHVSYGYYHPLDYDIWFSQRLAQVSGIECILTVSSIIVLGMLIFLFVIARLALKSTQTQVIVQHIVAPQSDATPN